MYCVKLTQPLRVKTGIAGYIETLPKGRCLQVVETNEVGLWVLLDDTEEHIYFRRGDPRIVEATIEDMANEV